MRNFDLDWDIVKTETNKDKIIIIVLSAIYGKIKRINSEEISHELLSKYGEYLRSGVDSSSLAQYVDKLKEFTQVLYIDGVPNGIQADILKKYFPGIQFILMGPTAEYFKETKRDDLLNGFEVYDPEKDRKLSDIVWEIYNDLKDSDFEVELSKIELGIIFTDQKKKIIYELSEINNTVNLYQVTEESGRKILIGTTWLDKNIIYRETLSWFTV